MNSEIEKIRHETARIVTNEDGTVQHDGADVELVDAWQWVFGYHPTTREYTGPQKAFLDQGLLGSEGKIAYLNPPNTCEDAPNGPIPPPTFRTYRRTIQLDAWELVPDYRNVIVYQKDSGQAGIIVDMELGIDLPGNVTTIRPTYYAPEDHAVSQWDEKAQAWKRADDYSHTPIFDTRTGELLPMLKQGEVPPAWATLERPPLAGDHEAVVWSAEKAAWALVADWRGTVYYLDGQKHQITELGDVLPENASLIPPPAPPTPGEQRDALMAEAKDAIAPLADAVELGIATDDEATRLNAWKHYRVALSRVDITASPVAWPDKPE